MNPKIIISFFIGTAVGVGGSFLGFKKYFETKTAKEIKEMREYSHECRKYADEIKKYADEMYTEYLEEINKKHLEEINKKHGMNLYSEYLEKLGAI